MPDGFKRKRRNRGDQRSAFYARYRSVRFALRMREVTPHERAIDIRVVCGTINGKGEQK